VSTFRDLHEVGAELGDLGFEVTLGGVGETDCGDDRRHTDHRAE